MARNKRTVDVYEVPEGADTVAQRRIASLMTALPLLNYDLHRLAVSCYLQGVEDGYDAAQRERMKTNEAIDTSNSTDQVANKTGSVTTSPSAPC